MILWIMGNITSIIIVHEYICACTKSVFCEMVLLLLCSVCLCGWLVVGKVSNMYVLMVHRFISKTLGYFDGNGFTTSSFIIIIIVSWAAWMEEVGFDVGKLRSICTMGPIINMIAHVWLSRLLMLLCSVRISIIIIEAAHCERTDQETSSAEGRQFGKRTENGAAVHIIILNNWDTSFMITNIV